MKYSLVVGRFQPLHNGHKALIRRLIDEGKHVAIGLMDTERDEKNPLSVIDRMALLHKAFGDKIHIAVLPPIAEVCFGRTPGYKVRRIFHGPDTEVISASAIRGDGEEVGSVYDPDFIEAFNRIADKIHETSCGQGFWQDGDSRNIGEVLAELHSEISEALECLRDGNPPDKNVTSMSGGEVQLADVLILLMDIARGYGFNIAEAALAKMKFNEGRAYLHGKQF